MLIDKLLDVSKSLKNIFLPIKNERYDWKHVTLGNKEYFLNLTCNIRYGFSTDLIPIVNLGDSLETQYLKDEIVFKSKKTNLKFGSLTTVRLLTDEHFYVFLNWNEKILNEYINYMKLYAVECI